MKLHWDEAINDSNNVLEMVRCQVCMCIEGRDVILQPKIDRLWKHVGRHTTKTPRHNVALGEFYWNNFFGHMCNKRWRCPLV